MNPHIIALNELHGVGIFFIKKIIEKLGSAEKVFSLSKKELLEIGINRDIANEILTGKTLKIADQIIERSKSKGIKILTFNEENYPRLLKEIPSAPPVLYIRGNISVLNKNFIAVVGTRSPDHYGISVAQKICSELVKKQMSIASGLAIGIDSVSHSATLRENGTTVAVLGSGVDNIYPKSNLKVAKKILETGAIISEFTPGTPPVPQNFPRRNRIISGISLGVIVVQSKINGGSMITAQYALQQDRDIFAVPGNIFDDRNAGTLKLIKDGAIPTSSAEDIISAFTAMPNLFKTKKIKSETPSIISNLSKSEAEIYSALEYSPLRIDQIEERSGKSSAEIFTTLLNLELKGVIKQNHCQMFFKV